MVWRADDGAKPEYQANILQCLERAGVQTEPLGNAAPTGSGIVIVSSINDHSLERVRQLSKGGDNRILAVLPRSFGPDASWQVLSAGAADVIAWHAGAAEIVAARIARWREVDNSLASPLVAGNLVGKSRLWIRLLRQIVEVSCFTTAPILLLGESGTGKELLARLIHTLDLRPDKKSLVVVDCTTIVPELSGSELFGHDRGAFTNALQPRDGAFSLADRGSLFLDEVGELPPAMQSQLLRVVQEKTYKRLGSNQWRRTDFRLVCATNRDLCDEVAQGRFRLDLYHRLTSWTLRIPPLRERGEDALLLAQHFLKELLPHAAGFDDAVRRYLLTRSYDGNVRELRHLILRISARHVGRGPISIGDIPEDERSRHRPPTTNHDSDLQGAVRSLMARGATLRDISRETAGMAVRIAISENNGNLQKAARLLGVTDRALQLRSVRGAEVASAPQRLN